VTAIRLERATGAAVVRHLDALAALRIEVFRDFPYLYEGSLDYEREYLRTYADSYGAVVVLALAGGEVVGASTAVPLVHETEAVMQPFIAQGFDVASIFYFGESVLRRPYRGQGIGVGFFAEREAHARAFGRFDHTAFCAVVRPADHPMRPAGYQPLDAFWTRRGYVRRPEMRCTMSWRDLGESTGSQKPMEFWLKALQP
jgi:GNAT superfamily N-acetyltransferase